MSSEQQLRRQVQSLTDKLKALNTGKKKTGGNNKSVPGTSGGSVSTPMGKGRNRRRRAGGASRQGELTFSRCELLRTLKLDAQKTDAADYLDLEPTNFGVLKKLATPFERIKWLKCHIYWKPAVGTTFGGLITYGIDWDSVTGTISREAVASYTPSVTHPVWQDGQPTSLILPPARLMSRQWYEFNVSDAKMFDRSPGRLVYAASATAQTTQTVLGEFWCNYTVVLSGTKA